MRSSGALASKARELEGRRSGGTGVRLKALRENIEAKFLAVGDVLAGAVEGVGELIAALDRLGEALDPAMVAATTEGLRDSAASLLLLPADNRARQERVGALGKAHHPLAEAVAEMQRNLSYLRVFAVNIRIAAAGIPAASGEFASFSEEISACIERAAAELAALMRDLNALRSEIDAAQQRQAELARMLVRLLPAIPDALEADAETLTAQHRRIAQVAEDVGVLAREVRGKVGAGLMALQIGDITRQRVEHVETGLDLIAEHAPLLEPDRRQRFGAFLHRLLAAQLRSSAADFHRDAAAIAGNLNGIVADARKMSRLGEAATGRAPGEEGALHSLERNVSRALALVGDFESSDRAARALAERAVAMTRTLAARMAGIEAIRKDVQQMALNSTLKSNRIGESAKPLSVISLELRQYAGQLETLGANALRLIERLTAEADSLAGPGEGGDSSERSVAAALEAAIGRIHAASAAIEADVAAANATGMGVVASLTRAASQFDLEAEVGSILDETAEELEGEANDIRADDIAEELVGLLERLARHYTMAQERDVHRQFANALGEAAESGESGAAEVDEDVLF